MQREFLNLWVNMESGGVQSRVIHEMLGAFIFIMDIK
jgi:hypothetical protein